MHPQTLYEEDYYLWLEKTAQSLSAGRWNELDIANLVEEIESMGRNERRALQSNIVIILQHLLKYRYQPERRSKSWRVILVEHRQRIERLLQESPSLKPYLQEVFASCHKDAVKLASEETGLVEDAFPLRCQFSVEQVLDIDFLPD